MTDAPSPPADPAVLVPAGLPILDAAAWVGHACWAELRLHQLLTDWLAVEQDHELGLALWRLRSHRAALAEAWHRRLPELRELPRPGFVEPSERGDQGFATLDALTEDGTPAQRATALAEALARLLRHYEAQAVVACGPADGPTAASLVEAIRTTGADLASLAAWAEPV